MSDISQTTHNDGSIFGATGEVRIETDSLGRGSRTQGCALGCSKPA